MTVTLHTGALSLSLAQQSPGDDAGYTIEKEEEFSLFFFFFYRLSVRELVVVQSTWLNE